MNLTSDLAIRALLGLSLAGGVAWLARRAGALTTSGAWAAVAIGAASTAAGWRFAWVLIAWFVASSALTRWGRALKAERSASVLPDERGRRAAQVLANGGLYATCALASTLFAGSVPGFALAVMAFGALAAAASDTWSTEIGLRFGARPRSILSWRAVAPGTSGGVTLAGFAGAAAGALFVALTVGAANVPTVLAILAAGLNGSIADSILGATLQARGRCTACGEPTERETHSCGGATEHAGGLRWMTNDVVNLLATAVGAATMLAILSA
jgi:uncharacterized protein (TIGR00297 family)